MQPGYITVSDTVVESEPLPEVAVTVIGYTPAGVPVCGLICWPDEDPPPGAPQAVMPAAIRSNVASTNCGAKRTAPPRAARTPRLSSTPNAAIHSTETGKNRSGLLGEAGNEAAVCGVVVMESIMDVFPLLPAGIVADCEKVAVAPDGSPDAVNVIAFAVMVFNGTTTIKLKFAGCPAVTAAVGVGTFTLKSSTVTAKADVVPPPGAGLFTEMFNVPL
jgi:hypothetical protein